MRRIFIPIIALGAAWGVGSAAFAQNATSGIINVNGTVAGRCAVNGVGAGGISGSINLGELAGANGALLPGLGAGNVPGAQVPFRVMCNTGAPVVEIEATRLANPATAGAGYTSVIDYTATADVTTTGGPTAVGYTTAETPPPATRVTLTAPLVATPGNNVTVRVHTMTTGVGQLLTAGSYAGTITVIISPS